MDLKVDKNILTSLAISGSRYDQETIVLPSWLDEFAFDPDSAQRIANLIQNYPLSLKDCADIIETVASWCDMYTTGTCLEYLKIFMDVLINGNQQENGLVLHLLRKHNEGKRNNKT